MPLLLYCVAPESAADTEARGVADGAVQNRVYADLRFFFSELSSDEISSRHVVTAARQVHAVVSDIFSRGAVLPFRYPTVIADEVELAQLAAKRGAAFREYLQRVGTNIQMDIRLTLPAAGPSPPSSPTGREYLESRARCQASLAAAAEKCRQMAHSAEWRIQQRGENIRCQALISRVEVISFLERVRTLELPDGVKAAVSGPWPPSGFWEDEPR